jgi:hypothetical protein
MGLEDLDQAEKIVLDSQDYLNTLWEAVSARRSELAAEAPVRMKISVEGLEVSGEFVTDDGEREAYDTLA